MECLNRTVCTSNGTATMHFLSICKLNKERICFPHTVYDTCAALFMPHTGYSIFPASVALNMLILKNIGHLLRGIKTKNLLPEFRDWVRDVRFHNLGGVCYTRDGNIHHGYNCLGCHGRVGHVVLGRRVVCLVSGIFRQLSMVHMAVLCVPFVLAVGPR